MSTPIPRTLDELRAVKDPVALAAAAAAYIEAGEQKIGEARTLRNAAIRSLIVKHGVAETARKVGLSTSMIKTIRGVR